MRCHEALFASGKRHDRRRRTFAGHNRRGLESSQANQAGQCQTDVGTAACRIEEDRAATVAGHITQGGRQVGLLVGQVAVDRDFPTVGLFGMVRAGSVRLRIRTNPLRDGANSTTSIR